MDNTKEAFPADFTTYISKNTKRLNTFMKTYFSIADSTQDSVNAEAEKKRDAIEADINKVFFKMLNMALPHFSNDRVSPNTWILSTDIELIPNQICLLALSNAPVRILAVVNKSQHRRAKDIVDGLQLSVRKIMLMKDSKEGSLYFKIEPNQENFFFSIKRGFYIYELNTLNKKLSAVLHKNELMLRESQMADITNIYFTHVDGMNERPTNELDRVTTNFGFEQFLLDEYPTKEWKEHVKGMAETSLKSTKKRFVTDSEEQKILDEEEKNRNKSKQNKKIEDMKLSAPLKPTTNTAGKIADIIYVTEEEKKKKYIRLMDNDLLDYKPTYAQRFSDQDECDDLLLKG